jgi:hypothetical protein
VRSITAVAIALAVVAAAVGEADLAAAQGAAGAGKSFADDIRQGGVPNPPPNVPRNAAGAGEGFAERFDEPIPTGMPPTPTPTSFQPTPTPTPEPTPTPTPTPETCQSVFGANCNLALPNPCCVPDIPGVPCQTNASSPSQPICTDVVAEPQCQPQVGAPCLIGGYQGCCDDTLSCVNNRCVVPQ